MFLIYKLTLITRRERYSFTTRKHFEIIIYINETECKSLFNLKIK